MKPVGLVLVVASLSLLTMAIPEAAFASRDSVEFEGSWSDVDPGDGAACQDIFTVADYQSRHFFVGPTRRTIVTHFSREDGTGFFEGLSFVSNFGYQNDFLYEETVTVGDRDYFVEIYGLLDRNVVYMEAAVQALSEDGQPLCQATAVFSGFN